MSRLLAVPTIAAVATALAATPAHATFPGANGPIAFRAIGPGSKLAATPMFTALPDGTQQSVVSRRQGFFSDWRADGRRIAFDFFQADGDEQVATMKPDGSDVRVLTSGPGIHEVPSWSPDGRRIVYGYSPESDPETPGFSTRLYTMRADGSRRRPFPMSNPGFDTEPRWSPDARWIAFNRLRVRGEEFKLAVFVVEASGGRARRITAWREAAEHPTWSPDSRWIAYNTSPNGTVKLMRPDGSGRRTIAREAERFGGHKPQFSPDGERILFMCENQGTLPEPPPDYNEDLCVMDTDGADVVNITNTQDQLENWPSWGPASKS